MVGRREGDREGPGRASEGWEQKGVQGGGGSFFTEHFCDFWRVGGRDSPYVSVEGVGNLPLVSRGIRVEVSVRGLGFWVCRDEDQPLYYFLFF